jgi:serine/threonine protein kinase/Tol biopolymer transport system component
MQVRETIGGYRILSPLGAGGMGEVWRAEDTKLGREVALKVLPEEFAADPQRLERFEREAKVLASLNHPNIATLFGLEKTSVIPSEASSRVEGSPEERDGRDSQHSPEKSGDPSTPASHGDASAQDDRKVTTFLSMELVEGEDLSERIKRGPVPVDEALAIALQIADALEAAHEAGIVHRDLKPANIKLTEDGVVKVLDFGLAKTWETEAADSSLSLSPTLTQHATAAGVILGTAAYMSPEQARGKKVDRRADIWSYGVVLWEMLTGRKLFEGDTVSDVLAAVLTRDLSFDDLPKDTPGSVNRLLSRCLRREPKERLGWIGDARLELVDDSSPFEAGASPRTLPGRFRPGLWLLVAALGILALGIIFWAARFPALEERTVRFPVIAPEGTVYHLEGLGPGPAEVSPDGTRVAYSARDEDGIIRVCIRALASVESVCLEGTEGAQYPFWSPDGESIGFFTRSGASLRVIPSDGGAVRTVCASRNGKGGTWNEDETIVFTPDSNTPLFAVPVEGGEPRQLTTFGEMRGDNSHRHPVFLPDGKRFLYIARSVRGSDGNTIMVGSLDGELNVELMRSPVAVKYAGGSLLYLRGVDLMARPFDVDRLEFTGDEVLVADGVIIIGGAARGVFSAADHVLVYQRGDYETRSELVWLDRSGNRTGVLGDVASYYSVAVSPDGSRVAVPVTNGTIGTHDLWIYDVARDLRSRVTFDDGEEFVAVWSPDGRELYYSANSAGPLNLYRLLPGESLEPEFILGGEPSLFATAVSPDGSRILISREHPETASDILMLDLDGGGEPEVVRATRFSEEHAVFSPDGRWVAYTSNESGRPEVYVSSVSGAGRQWQISSDGGIWPRWIRGTSEILFQDGSGRFVAVPVRTGETGVEIGTQEVLFDGYPGTRLYQLYDVTQDGQRILFRMLSSQDPPDPPTVVVNWQPKG